jgi:uncharacterized protein involved in type VI secretion and phage assembly
MSLLELLQEDDKRETGRIEGVAIGVVTTNKDDQGLGRVKVRYPWREGSQVSYWARLAMPAAGKERGVVWMPEVGDEVLLAFDKGDIAHPFVIGALWNGQDKPPELNADGENNTKLIKSRSGHQITLFDKTGEERLEVKTKGGHTILLDDKTGSARVEIKDSSGSNKIVIETLQNSLTIESGLSLKLKSQTIDIEAGAAMTIKASGTLTLQGALVRIN